MFTCAIHERGMIDAILHLFTRLPVEMRPSEHGKDAVRPRSELRNVVEHERHGY